MVVSTVIVFLLTYFVAYFALKWHRTKKVTTNSTGLKLPPCLPYLPIIGSLFIISDLKSFPKFFMHKSKKLGNIIALYMCNRYAIVLNGRRTIHNALVKHSLNFSDRPPFYMSKFYNPHRRGIVEHPYNEEFKRLHKSYLNILKQLGFGQGIMETRIKTEVEHFVQRVKLKVGLAFDPAFELTAAVSNVISSIIYGKSWSIDDPEFHEGMQIIKSMVRDTGKTTIVNFFPIMRFLPSFKQSLELAFNLLKRWDDHIKRVFKKISNEKDVKSFYSLFMEEETKFKNSTGSSVNDDGKQLVITFRDLFLAGTETTATSLQWFIYLMANHQEVQKQIRDEIDKVINRQRLPSLEDKPNLPILEASLLELMRFKTLLPLAVSHLTLRETNLDGFLIPSGAIVIPNLYSAHMDPDVWTDPEVFNIERFLNEEQTEVIRRDHVISFSLGKRACLGELLARQELFLFTSAIIQQFIILPPDGQEKVTVEEGFTTTISPSPFKVKLLPRY